MKIGTIFDPDFAYEELVFAYQKPSRYGPSPSILSDVAILSSDGKCMRSCSESDCTGGPADDCFESIEECQCRDDDFAWDDSADSKDLYGRCDTGSYCFFINGNPCNGCGCQPGEGQTTCRREWRRLSPSSRGNLNPEPCGLIVPEDSSDDGSVQMMSGNVLPQNLLSSCGCLDYYEASSIRNKMNLPEGAQITPEVLENYANSTSENCCGKLQDDVYVKPSGEVELDIPSCVDSEGNRIDYKRVYSRTSSSFGRQDRYYFDCSCPGEIKTKWRCEIEGETANCKEYFTESGGGYDSSSECNDALYSGASECGIYWRCDPKGVGGSDPCKPTKDSPNEGSRVYSKKSECETSCKFGYECDVVDGDGACVQKIGGKYVDEPECAKALEYDSCGLKYTCRLVDGEPKCVATEKITDHTYITKSVCEDLCGVKYICNINEVDTGKGTRYSLGCVPITSSDIMNYDDAYDTEEDCLVRANSNYCNGIYWRCELAIDDSSTCIPIKQSSSFSIPDSAYDSKAGCMANCEVGYKCKGTGQGCEKIPFDPSKGGEGKYADEQECCDKCCGCDSSHGRCEYTQTLSGFNQDFDVCIERVTKSVCDSLGGEFTCCPTGEECKCPECPSGQPKSECTSSEYKRYKTGSAFGFGTECYCDCYGKYELADTDGSPICAVCGENSSFKNNGCRCDEDYETESGNSVCDVDSYGPSEGGTGSGRTPGTDGRKSAFFQDCVPKKYKCDITSTPPKCVYVPPNQRDGTEFYYKQDCSENGCGRYNCVEEKCVPADVNSGESGYYANQAECEDLCGNFECNLGECSPNPFVKVGPGVYNGRKACLDAGCGKYKCQNGQCVPDLNGPFATKEACQASSCGRVTCYNSPVLGLDCQYDLGLQNGSARILSEQDGKIFADVDACVNSGCQRYKCVVENSVGKCVSDINGNYTSLAECESADPPCQCSAGEILCPESGFGKKCIPECNAPKSIKIIMNGLDRVCECNDCDETKIERQWQGQTICCPKCDPINVRNVNGIEKVNDPWSPTQADPCRCCQLDPSRCENDDIAELNLPGCVIVDVESCKHCRPCRVNASMDVSNCSCSCEGVYKQCGNRCVRCPEGRILNQSGCRCYCEYRAGDPKRPGGACQCGLDENCNCAQKQLPGTCFQFNYFPIGTCFIGYKQCPPGQFLNRIGLRNCDCRCLGTGAPPIGGVCGGWALDPSQVIEHVSVQGSDSEECPPNAFKAEDGKCYCASPVAFLNQDGSACECSEGYAIGSDGKTCVDPKIEAMENEFRYYQPEEHGMFLDQEETEPEFWDSPAINNESDQNKKKICDDVICPPGQCCSETVFGFVCRPC